MKGRAPRPSRRLRRAGSLVACWDEGQLTLINYLNGTVTTVSPLLLTVLDRLTDYVPRQELERRLLPVPQARTLIRRLVEQRVLIEEGSALDRRDAKLARVWAWGAAARFFHFSTQRVPYEEDPFRGRARLAAHARRVPPPSPYREIDGPRFMLPGAFHDGSGEFWKTLRARRTLRRCRRVPLSLNTLGQVLLWTWGQTHCIANPALGPYLLKTSPSGGARHPIEVYPLVRRVRGLRPGLYHYSVRQHALTYMRPALSGKQIVDLLAHQPWVRDAAVVFFMTAVVERSMWKYRHDHAYRVLLLDAGHLGQTFHLVCTKLGLAPFTSSAKSDIGIERYLGIDGISEISLYAAATGLPAGGKRAHPVRPSRLMPGIPVLELASEKIEDLRSVRRAVPGAARSIPSSATRRRTAATTAR